MPAGAGYEKIFAGFCKDLEIELDHSSRHMLPTGMVPENFFNMIFLHSDQMQKFGRSYSQTNTWEKKRTWQDYSVLTNIEWGWYTKMLTVAPDGILRRVSIEGGSKWAGGDRTTNWSQNVEQIMMLPLDGQGVIRFETVGAGEYRDTAPIGQKSVMGGWVD